MYTVAIVGTGFIAAKKHLPAWRRLRRRVRIVAVCDIDRSRAEAASREFGVPAAYDNVQEMLDTERPDFVDVCTPPTTHADVAVAALGANANVLVEKPLAASIADCERIVAAEGESQGQASVVHTELFHQCIIDARKRIERGDIGDFTGMNVLYCTPIDLYMGDPEHFVHRLPGGSMGETGPHVVYLARPFIGPIRDVWVQGRKLLPEYPWSPFEDYRLELMGERTVCTAVLTFTSKHSGFLIELWGTDGILKIDMQSKVLVNYTRPNRSPMGIGASAMREAAQIASGVFANGFSYVSGHFMNTHDRLIKDFFERSVNGLAPAVTAEDGLETVRVMSDITGRLEAD